MPSVSDSDSVGWTAQQPDRDIANSVDDSALQPVAAVIAFENSHPETENPAPPAPTQISPE